ILTTGAADGAAMARAFAGALVGAEPPALPVAGVPPAPAAVAPGAATAGAHSAAAAIVAARRPDRLWACVFAKVLLRARRELPFAPVGRVPYAARGDVIRLRVANLAAARKLRASRRCQPQRKPVGDGAGGSGLEA